jgi:hypothetical protein
MWGGAAGGGRDPAMDQPTMSSMSGTAYGPRWWTDEDRAHVKVWFDSTEMCDTCNRRVPKSQIEQGLHLHPAVMD